MLRYVIVEDHPAVVHGIEQMLEGVAVAVAAVGSVAELSTVDATVIDPDVAIVDLGLPDACRRQVLAAVHQQLPGVPVVVITAAHDWPDAVLAYSEGARGYLRKSDPVEVLQDAVRVVAAGGTHLTRQLKADIADTRELELSERQVEVLRLAARGRTNDEMRRATGLSLGTVENIIAQIRRELPNRLARLAAGPRGLTILAQSMDPGCEHCRELVG